MKTTASTKGRISNEALDAIIGEAKTPEDVFGREGLLKRLTAQLMERMLGAELGHHLAMQCGGAEPAAWTTKNRRNGRSAKTVQTDRGPVTIAVPRDRDASFAPVILPQHTRRLPGFDDKILALYSRGTSTRDICEMMTDFYGVDISPELVSQVTEAVREDIVAWQARPLSACYAVGWLDAIHLKIRSEGVVQSKALYVAVGLDLAGNKEIFGLWLEATEGAKFWQRVLGELRARGLADMLILCCDGLKGLPAAVAALYPQTTVQSCIVHQIRYCLSFVSWQDRKALVASLRGIYGAPTEAAALEALADVERTWGTRYPMIYQSWQRNWEVRRPFLELPPELRKLVYTTNQIESINASIRRTVAGKGHFTSDEAALKSVFLTLRNLAKKWGRREPSHWKTIYTQLNIYFGDRALKTN